MLSIVIITCNRKEELRRTIVSCEENVSVTHEYIVIDNGSTDGTDKEIKELMDSGCPIIYLKQTINLGVSGGRNVGFNYANGDVCYFIDDDAIVLSTGERCLDQAYLFFKENPNVYAMGTDCFDTERQTRLVGPVANGGDINEICVLRSYIGCSHFIRKETNIFPVDYLYPNNLIYGSEELYLGLNVFKHGGIVINYPYVKVEHNPSKKTRESRKERQRHGHINTYVIKRYYLPFPFSLVSAFFFLLRITRFEKLKAKEILSDFAEARKRFDKQYVNRLSFSECVRLLKQFNMLYIL